MARVSRVTKWTGDGLFLIDLKCPKQIEAGGTIRFSAYFLHQRDGPVNPTGLTAKVFEGVQMTTLVATLTVYQDIYGTGSFFADFNVSSTQGSGPLYVVWSGSYESIGTTSSFPVQGTQVFRVTNPSARVQ